MPIAYVSGPMTGYYDHNRAAFYRAERRLRAAGWHVYNPARIDDRYPVIVGDGPSAMRTYASRDLAILVKNMRAEDGDAIVVIDGWWHSLGSLAECAVGRWVQLRILGLEAACQ